MQLFPLLRTLDHEIQPEGCKLHLATWNGREDPLDVYFAGNFEAWQAHQRRRNFECQTVLSLIRLPERDRWLFVGVFDSHGCEPGSDCHYNYNLRRRSAPDELAGRLVLKFRRRGRQAYPWASNVQNDLHIVELWPEPLTIPDFPGYKRLMLTKAQLDTIVARRPPSWHAALSSVAGVYTIADRESGRLYVGSATGDGGIWSRWCDYARDGHGGNRDLRTLLQERGDTYAANFQYGILETADSSATTAHVLARETHWKNLLLTRRPFGYNGG